MDELREETRRALAAAEARIREVEQLARRAVADAIMEIDRTLGGPRQEASLGAESA